VKTIYTDRYGILPWAFAFIAIVFAARAFEHGPLWQTVFSSAATLFFAYSSVRAWRRRSVAVRNGGDPTIVRIVDK
jgi:hypothetical protein